ncbi:LysR substrate-binding domain-containing protein [Xanthobacter sp. DSM 24535]|uniref:LysR substrate-binding domain-containing protein n=1 Tax=Roseixanthobacter psychrophilus TaxID=3119917 RepID=UPI003726C542
MTLEQMRVFLAVADRLHMTRAAEELHMTQSAVSASIAALEVSTGMQVFHRVGRRIALTAAGTLLRDEAAEILGRVRQAESALADLSGLRRGSLSLYASQTIGNYWLAPLMQVFRTEYPDITLSLTIGNTSQVSEAVLNGAADLGFVEGNVEEPMLARVPAADDQLVLVLGRGSPLFDCTHLAPADLTRLRWVMREKGSGTRQIFETACHAYGVDPASLNVTLELPSNEAVISAVAAGGATVISRLVAESGLRAKTLRAAPLVFPERPFHVLRHAERYQSRAAAALLSIVKTAQPLGSRPRRVR